MELPDKTNGFVSLIRQFTFSYLPVYRPKTAEIHPFIWSPRFANPAEQLGAAFVFIHAYSCSAAGECSVSQSILAHRPCLFRVLTIINLLCVVI